MMNMKYIKLTFYIILACGAIAFIARGYLQQKKSESAFLEKNYNGIIVDIKHFRGNRGDPYVKIGDQWVMFGIHEDKVRNYIKVSDSIVKDPSTSTIKIYRRNTSGQWDEKIFY